MRLALHHHRPRSSPALRLFACGLAFALAICGFASVRIAMLGTNHVHLHAIAVPAEMKGWQDFRRAAHVGGAVVRPPHDHALFERHRHDAIDTNVASVASLDADAGALLAGDAPATVGAPALAGLPSTASVAADGGEGMSARWAQASARGIERIEAGRLERPPRG